MKTLFNLSKRTDFVIGMVFAGLTALFLVLFFASEPFFNWAFDRHHNLLSWYIRPIWILPIAFFAFKRSWTGVMASIFCLFTSMFWFPVPASINPKVVEFLAFEQEYLKGSWDFSKIIVQLAVPLFFAGLIYTAWHRSLKALIGVMVAAAVLKVLWSAAYAGEAGLSIIKPAVSGLFICIAAVVYFKKKKKAVR
ncbi:MAG TPA: hypothetical protein DCS67_10335 [Clostridiales bacterium UBA8960]|nr:hypothetical protein [Clostridiales bacterium UBA8960]